MPLSRPPARWALSLLWWPPATCFVLYCISPSLYYLLEIKVLLQHRNSHSGKMASLYWDSPLILPKSYMVIHRILTSPTRISLVNVWGLTSFTASVMQKAFPCHDIIMCQVPKASCQILRFWTRWLQTPKVPESGAKIRHIYWVSKHQSWLNLASQLTQAKLICLEPGGRLNIRMLSFQYRDPHVKDNTVFWPSYL